MELTLENLRSRIDPERVPDHVAIIMDGNGRWAKEKGKMRVFGHRSALDAVRNATESCAEIGVKYLTLYAFSTENWNRPKIEVRALMELLVDAMIKELPTLMENQIRLRTIGRTDDLPDKCRAKLLDTIEKTSNNSRMDLILALSYSGKWDIANAAQLIAQKAADGEIDPSTVDEQTLADHLSTAGIPDPELMIRTSGEMRISNFLMWQLAYAELVFLEKYWPEFKKEDLFNAIYAFQNRERRFGMTSEQVVE